jgi:hypothetical protein
VGGDGENESRVAAKIMNELINSYNQQLTTNVCTLKNYIKNINFRFQLRLIFFIKKIKAEKSTENICTILTFKKGLV